MDMLSAAAFSRSRELVGSTSVDQLFALQDDIDERLHGLLIPTRTFEIPEILESILEHLDFFELLKVIRVSRCFYATIIGSTRLRRKLFLPLRDREPDVVIKAPDTAAQIQLNPLLERLVHKSGFLFTGIDCVPEGLDKEVLKIRTGLTDVPVTTYLRFETDFAQVDWLSDNSAKPWEDKVPKGLWAQSRVTTDPLTVQLCFAQADRPETLEGFDQYCVYGRSLEAGQATLAALYDLSVEAVESFAKRLAERKSRDEDGIK